MPACQLKLTAKISSVVDKITPRTVRKSERPRVATNVANAGLVPGTTRIGGAGATTARRRPPLATLVERCAASRRVMRDQRGNELASRSRSTGARDRPDRAVLHQASGLRTTRDRRASRAHSLRSLAAVRPVRWKVFRAPRRRGALSRMTLMRTPHFSKSGAPARINRDRFVAVQTTACRSDFTKARRRDRCGGRPGSPTRDPLFV